MKATEVYACEMQAEVHLRVCLACNCGLCMQALNQDPQICGRSCHICAFFCARRARTASWSCLLQSLSYARRLGVKELRWPLPSAGLWVQETCTWIYDSRTSM